MPGTVLYTSPQQRNMSTKPLTLSGWLSCQQHTNRRTEPEHESFLEDGGGGGELNGRHTRAIIIILFEVNIEKDI